MTSYQTPKDHDRYNDKDTSSVYQTQQKWFALYLTLFAIINTHHAWLGLFRPFLGRRFMDGEVWNEVFDAIFAPVLVVATFALYERLVDAPHTRWSRWILVAALAVAANGIGVHSVANRLHWLVNPGQERKPVQFESSFDRELYVWDEFVGHALWFGGLFAAWLALALAARDAPRPLRASARWAALGTPGALCLALWLAGAAIEGQQAPLVGAFAAATAAAGMRARNAVAHTLAAAAVAATLALAAWHVRFGLERDLRVLGLGPFGQWPRELWRMLGLGPIGQWPQELWRTLAGVCW